MNEAVGVIGAAIGAGLLGLAATMTKYWLDRRKAETESEQVVLSLMHNHIDELEKQHTKCLEDNAALSRRVGYLEATIEKIK